MKLEINDELRNLPDFLIVGTGKAGTSSLHNYLKEHPQLFLPKDIKETLFLQIITNTNKTLLKYLKNAITDFESYLKLFDEANENQLCGEVTPSYLYYHEHTITNLKEYHPKWKDVKIIIILREPVDKVISQYHHVSNALGFQDHSLEKALKKEKERLKKDDTLVDLYYVNTSLYYEQVKAFMDNFKYVKVFLYDDLKENREKFLKEIFDFIGVDNSFIPPNINKRYNVSKVQKVPRNKAVEILKKISHSKINHKLLSSRVYAEAYTKVNNLIKHSNSFFVDEKIKQTTRDMLKILFKNDVIKLQNLINVDLSRRWGY